MKFIAVCILLFSMGLLVEKGLHPDFSLENVVRQFKKDVVRIVSALFSEPKLRHVFSGQLGEELKLIARSYSHSAFEINVVVAENSGTPFVGINFVPARVLAVDELEELTNFLLLKFRRYLCINSLNWRTFACFASGHDFVNVFLYYAEFPEDVANLNLRYQATLREKVAPDYGYLRDEELEKELETCI